MECPHDDVEPEEGERVCKTCGRVVGNVIDEGAEWRVFGNTEDDPARTGTITSELLPNSSYGSVMMKKRIPNQSEESKMIAKMSSWSFSSHGERSWMGIFDAIQTSCSRVGLPKAILLDACGLFKNVEEAQKTRGETRRALMAGSIFIACRQHNATRTHEEVASLFSVSIRAMCKALTRFEGDTASVLSTQLGIAERVCAELELPDDQRDKIVLMLQTLPEMEHTPKTIVAGVVSIVLGGDISKVSKASGVSAVSIRKIVDKFKAQGNM